MRKMCCKILACCCFVAVPNVALALCGKVITSSDKVFFLVDVCPYEKADPPPSRILPNQVLTLHDFDEKNNPYITRSFFCFENSKPTLTAQCLNTYANLYLPDTIIANVVRIQSDKHNMISLVHKRYGFQMNRSDRNGGYLRFQKTGGTANSYQNFQEVVLARDTMPLYKDPSLNSQIILPMIHKAPRINPQPVVRKEVKSTTPVSSEIFATFLGDRVFLVGYESPFYKAIVVRDESMYFWGYIYENDLQKAINTQKNIKNLNNNPTLTAPKALEKFDYIQNWFKTQYSLESLHKQYGGIIPIQSVNSSAESSDKRVFIKTIFDTQTQRFALANDAAALPYLPISQEFDAYISEQDRAKVLEIAHKRGKPTFEAWFEVFVDSATLDFIEREPEIKLLSLKLYEHTPKSPPKAKGFIALSNTSKSNAQEVAEDFSPQLCIGGDLLYKGALEIFSDPPSYAKVLGVATPSSKNPIHIYHLPKARLAQGELLLDTSRLDSGFADYSSFMKAFTHQKEADMIPIFYSDNSLGKPLRGYVHKGDVVPCLDYDISKTPHYVYAQSIRQAIAKLTSKPLDSSTVALFNDKGENVGYWHKNLKNLEEAIALAENYGLDDISLLLQTSNMATTKHERKRYKKSEYSGYGGIYGGDRKVRYDSDKFVESRVVHIVFFGKLYEKVPSKESDKARTGNPNDLKLFSYVADESSLSYPPKISQEILMLYKYGAYLLSPTSLIFVKISDGEISY